MLIIPIFVPHEGCPHDCVFCNQKTISGQFVSPTAAEVQKNIDRYRNILHRYDSVQVAFFGGSFTGIPVQQQISYLEAAAPYIKNKLIDSIRISTRPDYISEPILTMLRQYGVRTIELGAQSMNNRVLALSGRGHTAEQTINASRLICSSGFELGLQTMPGLPGASVQDDIDTADQIIALKPDIVRIYPTIVIKGTFLHTMYERGEYLPPALDKTVALCAQLMVKYETEHIKVIRMGLQSSDHICLDGEIAAGPYHPAFGQLVKSYIALDKLLKIGEIHNDIFTAYVPAKELSDYIGQNKSNVMALKERFGYKKVQIKPMI